MEEKVQKRFIRAIIGILFGLSVLLTGLVLCVRPMCASAVREAFIGNAVRLRIFDGINECFPELSSEQGIEIDTMVRNHRQLDQVAEKYLKSIAKAVSSDKEFEAPDIEKNLERLNEDILANLEKFVGSERVQQNRERLLQGLYEAEKDVTDILGELPFFISNFGGDALVVLQLYRILTAGWFQVLMILVAGGFGVLLYWMGRWQMKGIKTIGVAGIVDGVFLGCLIPAMLNGFSLFVTNRILGRSMYLNTSPLRIAGVILCLAGVLLLAVRFYLLRREGRKA